MLLNGGIFTCFQMRAALLHSAVVHGEATQKLSTIAERDLRFHYRTIISSAIMNTILHGLSVNYGPVVIADSI